MVNYETLTQEIADLQGAIPVEERKLAEYQASLDANKRALLDDIASEASAATIANTRANIERYTRLVDEQLGLVERMRADLKYKLALRTRIDQAAATAIANGSTPEAAFQLASASVSRAETLKQVATWAGIIALVVLIGYAIMKYRKKAGK